MGFRAFSRALTRFGVIGMCRCIGSRLFFHSIRQFFGFNAWHCSGTFSCRAYKQRVVDLANQLAPRRVVDIGCGLGEVLVRINAKDRIGFDVDSRVVRAAQWLHGSKAAFFTASLEENEKIANSTGEAADVLIMVNWIHELPPQDLIRMLNALLARIKIRFLIVDGIFPDIPGYRYHHGIDVLNFFGRITITSDADEVRKLYLLELRQ